VYASTRRVRVGAAPSIGLRASCSNRVVNSRARATALRGLQEMPAAQGFPACVRCALAHDLVAAIGAARRLGARPRGIDQALDAAKNSSQENRDERVAPARKCASLARIGRIDSRRRHADEVSMRVLGAPRTGDAATIPGRGGSSHAVLRCRVSA
jgi:hypothetical protein